MSSGRLEQSGRTLALALRLDGPLKYDAFLHPAQFDSVHSVEGHWVFFFVLELQRAVRKHSHLEFHHKCL